MTTHDGHKLVYVYEAVVERPCSITSEGDVLVVEVPWEVVDLDGVVEIYCKTCGGRVHAGEGGLAEDWAVV